MKGPRRRSSETWALAITTQRFTFLVIVGPRGSGFRAKFCSLAWLGGGPDLCRRGCNFETVGKNILRPIDAYPPLPPTLVAHRSCKVHEEPRTEYLSYRLELRLLGEPFWTERQGELTMQITSGFCCRKKKKAASMYIFPPAGCPVSRASFSRRYSINRGIIRRWTA